MGLVVSLPPGQRHVVPQDSKAWTAARVGHLTASRMKDVLAVSKRDGKPLEARENYLDELVTERWVGFATDHYVTAAMQWGLDYEPKAKEAYGQVKNCDVDPAGFILHPSIEFFGASPDAFIGTEGLAEFKCPTTLKHMRWIMAGEIPAEHRPQMLAQLACTGRQWCDFVSFDPRAPAKQRVFIRRLIPLAEELDSIEEEARKFLAEVEFKFHKVSTMDMAA
jgi:putative phage-type endonuclease